MGEMVSYPSNGGTSEGYLAVPSSGSGPAVIVIQEWWGLVTHIKELADRFAEAGFVALAPDLYHGLQASEPDEAGKLMMGLAMDQAAKDIAGAAAYLAGRPDVTGRVAAVGFCMGGSLALWSATLSEHVGAAVGFYPAVPWERMSPQWDNYAGKAAMIHASEEDGTCAAPGIQQAVRAIETAGGEVVCYDYPGTHHAFFNDDRPEVYDREASALAWARTLEFLRSRLG
ncbi:dienelactone hydrolase family protein [Planosporangium mesophilum]|uniref:Carboxymethylenebutenolidase n=1 Tax=Planosporangium mesophilum TaxID=689768 RepID=A0A8J3TEQ9_9ACTN|nr:dienelactone hydrolase family protein [Planosporangium mesophilum]NJC84843.1 dienelactone hydrolase family protein [Planosporangium mesophilum]GII24136.1 carboxymethylenebutenolidase [Planosporangium mesophilum]